MSTRIPLSVIRDAIGMAHSIYRMNAPHAVGYAFTVASNKKEVGIGEFIRDLDMVKINTGFSNIVDSTIKLKDESYEGYYDFTTGKVTNLTTGRELVYY